MRAAFGQIASPIGGVFGAFPRLGRAAFAGLLLGAFVASSATAGEGAALVRRDIERFVRANLGSDADQGRVTIEVPTLRGFDVDRARHPGPLRTEITTRASRPLRGRSPVAVALYAGDRLVKRSVVTPSIRLNSTVVVPTRDIRPGTILSAGDFRLVERDGNRLPRNVVRGVEEVAGMRARRSLRQDQPFRADQVERVPLVERGDRVRVVLRTGPLEISTIGKAQEKGALGDWIRVQNLDSKRELTGRVDAEGRVHVAF